MTHKGREMQQKGFLATEKVEIFPRFVRVCSIASEVRAQ